MTLLRFRGRDELLSVRFACSPVWETAAAVRTLVNEQARSYHEPWHRLVRDRLSRIDLSPLLALEPREGFVPDFLTPPPRAAWPRLRDQLDEVRATPAAQVARELERCRETVQEDPYRRLLDSFLVDPAAARDLLAARLHEAWAELVAPFWVRIRTLLAGDIDLRARALARWGLRRVLDDLHPQVRWTKRGVSLDDGNRTTAVVDERGLVLMPSAYSWPAVIAIADEPWQPTIVYPARGIAELWQAPTPPPDALARLLGRTRALVLASLDQPRSTTTLAGLLELSPAGASRHLLALRDAGLVSTRRHGHELRYGRTTLGSALLDRARRRSGTARGGQAGQSP
jgi:DNA-binding transcriptional ArsR family regulator